MSDSLSLREIRNELYELVIERAELERDIAAQADLSSAEVKEGLLDLAAAHTKIKGELEKYRAQLDISIKAYGLAKAEKVDQIVYVRRRLKRDAESDELEVKRLKARAAARMAEYDRLTHYVKEAMTAAGEKRIEGEHAALCLEANPVSVEVTDVSLIPDALKKQSVTLDCATWIQIMDALSHSKHTILALELLGGRQKAEAIPDKTNIKAILACPVCKAGVGKKDCEACDSTGYAPCSNCQGSGLITSGSATNLSDTQCSQCGGSGNATIAGARLEFGQKLMIR